ncbi:spore germination protein KB [Paenibacillus sp. V4I3]|uniref:GerAB/ArcD/ProY family transporter n=1 Tax=unclassified Paenibacillus TaxID=185978 RepID=UPI0027802243|nr:MULTISPECIES: endospore germination permease [unclassified Paenibacillus]MDQ0873930.1 spore germination protein KB [Paenibacillus sp. V4I3]MDQ0890193.1 spore germination protein KB [Paenibacillus sp. V4I9]
MLKDIKISVRQFAVLVIIYTIGTTILVIPSGLAVDAKQDAWLAAIIGVGLNLLVVCLYNKVGDYFPNLTLVEYNEKLFGKWPGKMLSLVFLFFSFIGAATVLFYMANFINTHVMPETPIQAVNSIFAIVVVMGVRLGLETLVRAAEIFFPWIIMLFIILVACLLPEIQVEKLQPMFSVGSKPLIKAALSVAGTSSLPFIVLFMVFPAHVNHFQKAKKAFLIATLIGGACFVIITFLCISVLGTKMTERHMFPSYVLAKQINIGNFLERVEILIAGIWFLTVYFKTTFYFYGFVTGLAQILKIEDYRPLVWPLGMILVVFSLVVYPNVAYMAEFDTKAYIPYALTIGLLYPILIIGVAAIRKSMMKN